MLGSDGDVAYGRVLAVGEVQRVVRCIAEDGLGNGLAHEPLELQRARNMLEWHQLSVSRFEADVVLLFEPIEDVKDVLPNVVLLLDIPCVEEVEEDGDHEDHIDQEGQKVGVRQICYVDLLTIVLLLTADLVLVLAWEGLGKDPVVPHFDLKIMPLFFTFRLVLLLVLAGTVASFASTTKFLDLGRLFLERLCDLFHL